MADAPVVHFGENSPEYVAYRLLSDIAAVEGQQLAGHASRGNKPPKKWILDTYAECLDAVMGRRVYPTNP